MGTTNFGTQTIQVNYNAPADSITWTKRLIDVIQRGIYKGALLTKVNDTSITLSTLVCEIGDDNYQVRISTSSAVTLTVGSATPFIVLRWTYTGAVNNYMDVLALAQGAVLPNDLVVGKCSYAGSVLNGFDYGDSVYRRTTPLVSNLMLRVEPKDPADMTVVIRAGRTNYGTSNLEISEQISSVFVAPTTNPRIDVVYVDTDGVVKVYTGSESASPTAPAYNNKKVLAEITLTVGMTAINKTNIKDTRNYI